MQPSEDLPCVMEYGYVFFFLKQVINRKYLPIGDGISNAVCWLFTSWVHLYSQDLGEIPKISVLRKSSRFFFPSTVDRSLHLKAWIRLPNICTEYKGWCRMSPHMKLLFLASLHLCFLYLFFTHIFCFFFSYHHGVSKSRYEIIIKLSKKWF